MCRLAGIFSTYYLIPETARRSLEELAGMSCSNSLADIKGDEYVVPMELQDFGHVNGAGQRPRDAGEDNVSGSGGSSIRNNSTRHSRRDSNPELESDPSNQSAA